MPLLSKTFSTRSIAARPPISKDSPRTSPFSTMATLRRSEEKSTAKIFINNFAFVLAELLDGHDPKVRSPAFRRPRASPPFDPFNYCDALRIRQILLQSCADNLFTRIQPIQ